MITKKELLKYYPRAYLHYKITTDECYVFLDPFEFHVNFNFSKNENEIKINNKDFKYIRENGVKMMKSFNTEDYIDIIYKAYKEKFREEIEQRWRVSRLRAKLAVKEDVKTQPRRKI